MGPILTEIGNGYIELATTVVKQITRMFDAINNARAAQALGGQRQAQAGFAEASSNLRLAQEAFNKADDKSTDGAAYTRLRNATQGYEMATRSLRQANQNVANTKHPFTATGKPLEEKLKPPGTQTGGSTQQFRLATPPPNCRQPLLCSKLFCKSSRTVGLTEPEPRRPAASGGRSRTEEEPGRYSARQHHG